MTTTPSSRPASFKELLQAASQGAWRFDEVPTSCGRAFRIGTREMIDKHEASKGQGSRALPAYAVIYDDWGHGETENKANAQYIARLNPETMKLVLEALEEASTALQHMPPDEPQDGTLDDRRKYNEKWSAWNRRQCAAVVQVRSALSALNQPTP